MSDVTLETQPREGRIVAGGNLVLICSVAKGTGTITFSWHREGIERSLGRKTQRSLSAELQISSVKEHDAGRYYCAADNSRGPMLSQRIRVALGSKFLIPLVQPWFARQGCISLPPVRIFLGKRRDRGIKI